MSLKHEGQIREQAEISGLPQRSNYVSDAIMTKNARLLRILDKQNLPRLLIVCLACGSLFLRMRNSFVYRK